MRTFPWLREHSPDRENIYPEPREYLHDLQISMTFNYGDVQRRDNDAIATCTYLVVFF